MVATVQLAEPVDLFTNQSRPTQKALVDLFVGTSHHYPGRPQCTNQGLPDPGGKIRRNAPGLTNEQIWRSGLGLLT
jgi:hypothetical protein